MNAMLKTMLAVVILVGLAAATTTFAGPDIGSDLDRPVTAFDASANETGNNATDTNTPGENSDVPPVEVFGKEIPGLPVLFIIDRSCSMYSRWSDLTAELDKVLTALAKAHIDLQKQWKEQNYYGPQPHVEFALIAYSSSAQIWPQGVVTATDDNASAAMTWLGDTGGSTNWTDGLYDAQSFGGVFRTIYFMTDGQPNVDEGNINTEADNLANLYTTFPGGMTFLCQYFQTSSHNYGRSEMVDLSSRMDGKENITGVMSDATDTSN